MLIILVEKAFKNDCNYLKKKKWFKLALNKWLIKCIAFKTGDP